jgi:hypothetical protein
MVAAECHSHDAAVLNLAILTVFFVQSIYAQSLVQSRLRLLPGPEIQDSLARSVLVNV